MSKCSISSEDEKEEKCCCYGNRRHSSTSNRIDKVENPGFKLNKQPRGNSTRTQQIKRNFMAPKWCVFSGVLWTNKLSFYIFLTIFVETYPEGYFYWKCWRKLHWQYFVISNHVTIYEIPSLHLWKIQIIRIHTI